MNLYVRLFTGGRMLPQPWRFFSRAAEDVALQRIRKVLCVAEKNDAARGIAELLSNSRMRRREGFSKFNKIYEYDYQMFGQNVTMVMTSVSGHLLAHDFIMPFRKWLVPRAPGRKGSVPSCPSQEGPVPSCSHP